MEDIKKNNETMNQEEKQNENATPDQNKAEQKQPGKVKAFFAKHSGKIKTGLLVAGGIAAGVAVDKFGIRLGGRKKDDDHPAATEADV